MISLNTQEEIVEQNIVMQLKKAADGIVNKTITFRDGKTTSISPRNSNILLNYILSIRNSASRLSEQERLSEDISYFESKVANFNEKTT